MNTFYPKIDEWSEMKTITWKRVSRACMAPKTVGAEIVFLAGTVTAFLLEVGLGVFTPIGRGDGIPIPPE